jgi:antitoxin MazE
VRVSKWGNSLAVRIPVAVVDALSLKEGNDVEIHVARERVLALDKTLSLEDRLVRLSRLRRRMPKDYRFDREEANRR